MMRIISILIKKLTVDLIKTYAFLLLYPFRLLIELVIKTVVFGQIKQYLVRFILLPLLNIFFFICYHFVVKPIKKYHLSFILPKLYNSSIFLREFNDSDSSLLESRESIYKYLLYNRNNKNSKYPDPETTQDNLYYYLMSTKKIISPGWRQHHIYFYHQELKEYRDVLYNSAVRVIVRQALDVKLLDSFAISLKSVRLFCRFISSNINAAVYENYCFLRYYYKEKLFHVDKILHFNSLAKISNFLCNSNVIITYLNNSKVLNLYLEALSLGEESTERSIYLSKRFGFSGNLYLAYSSFITQWRLPLNKNSIIDAGKMFKDYNHTENWEFERPSMKGKVLKRLKNNHIATDTYPFDAYDFAESPVEKDRTFPEKEFMLRYTMPQTQRVRTKNAYRYNLPKEPTYMINKTLLNNYRRKVIIYTNLYSFLGKLTKLFLRVNTYLSLDKRMDHRNSFLESKFKHVFVDLDKLFILVIILVLLESIFFIIRTLY